MNFQELEKKYPPMVFGFVKVKRDFLCLFKENGDLLDDIKDMGWTFFLDHSCDEWTIGNLHDAINFNGDLEKAINYVKER